MYAQAPAVAVPAIASIVYTIIDVLKTAFGGKESFRRFLPLTALLLGAACGAVAFYFVPGSLGTDNLPTALVMGASSGLSSTGTNQIVKQITAGCGKKEKEKEKGEKES